MIKVGDYIKIQKRRHHQSWYDDDSYMVVGFTRYSGGRVLVLDRNLSKLKIKNTTSKYNEILESLVDLDIKTTRMRKFKKIFND